MDKLNGHFRAEIILVLLAIGIGVLENIVPKPFPFLKLGLANVVTVSAIIRYGTMTGLRINVLRSTGAALLLGIIATPTYLLSLAGGIVSSIVMGNLRNVFSVTGISVAGSLCSLCIQLFLAMLLLPGLPVGTLAMPLIVWGILSGAVTGIVAVILLRKGFPWIREAGVDSPCSQE